MKYKSTDLCPGPSVRSSGRRDGGLAESQRSGLNCSGSGYIFGSRVIALLGLIIRLSYLANVQSKNAPNIGKNGRTSGNEVASIFIIHGGAMGNDL